MYSYSRLSPIESEKLTLNKILVAKLRPKTVLEPFAGDGTSTRIFARHAEQVVAIEKDRKYIARLLRNSLTRKVTVMLADNLRVLPLLSPQSFELIDLDPYGSCYSQIELSARLLDRKGVLMISSGEIQRVVRGLKLARFPGSREYKGRRAVLWARDVWIPYLRKLISIHGHRVRVLHSFVSPVLIRVIFVGEKAPVDSGFVSRRPKYLGWFRKA